MKGYVFRLSTVARVRYLQQEIAKNRLMIAMRELNKALSEERKWIDEIQRFEMPGGDVCGAELIWGFDQLQRLHHGLLAAKEEVVDAKSKSESLRNEWLAANRQCEMLGRLDARMQLVFENGQRRLQASELDDLNNSRFAKKVLS